MKTHDSGVRMKDLKYKSQLKDIAGLDLYKEVAEGA